jgi:sugar phosphate isomerase/epimerase
MVGIKIFVIHSSGEPIENTGRADRIESAKKSLCELAEYAVIYNAVISVENLPRTCLGNNSSELHDIVSCDERLKICFDTNHLLSENHFDFLQAVSSKLITTHFSDYDFINERHWLPGEGDINWKTLMDTLDEVGYDGPVVYEMPMKASLKTIIRSRDLTPADIRLNHNELESRSPLTIIGKRLPDLDM